MTVSLQTHSGPAPKRVYELYEGNFRAQLEEIFLRILIVFEYRFENVWHSSPKSRRRAVPALGDRKLRKESHLNKNYPTNWDLTQGLSELLDGLIRAKRFADSRESPDSRKSSEGFPKGFFFCEGGKSQ